MTIIQTTTDLPKRHDFDYYRTPDGLVNATIRKLFEDNWLSSDLGIKTILDPGAGDGVWGKYARRYFPNAYINAIDIQPFQNVPNYTAYIVGDYLQHNFMSEYDLILGNPPFLLAEAFVDKSLRLLKDRGVLVQLLKTRFLQSDRRYEKFFKHHDYRRPVQTYTSVRRVSFSGDNKTNDEIFSIIVWKKVGRVNRTFTDWLSWEYDDLF